MTEQQPNENEAIEEALYTLAATTETEQRFATLLEAALLNQAQQMQRERVAWWRRLFSVISAEERAPLRLRYAFAALLLLATLFWISTPAARATVWDWLYSFGLIEERAVANQTLVLEHAAEGSKNSLPLAAIRAQAPFPIATPTWLPVDLIFTAGFVEKSADGTQVTLAYHLPPKQVVYSPEDPLLFVLISDGVVDNRPLLAQENVVPVRLNKVTGMYAHGGWRSRAPITAESTTVDGLDWDPALDAAWVSWQNDGLNYLLYAQGLGVQQTEMLAIASSMDME